MTQAPLHSTHTAYILRVWHTTNYRVPEWRASLTEVTTNQKIGFTDPEALVEFLSAIGVESGNGTLETYTDDIGIGDDDDGGHQSH